jgi:hypothetical protein
MYAGGMRGGKPARPSEAAIAARLDALRRFGADAVSFQGLETAIAWWEDDAAPAGTGALVAYLDTGRSWIAVGRPLVRAADRGRAARRFARTARARGRRAVFFGVESLGAFGGFRRLVVGAQSQLRPAAWPETLRRSRKLREQLRRARAKGVTVRIAGAAEVAPGTELRRDIERLRDEWLEGRTMEPMSFLVAVEPFHAPPAHLYVVAERRGRVVQALSAVPVYARRGWLFEDMLRGREAPNGTTELVLDLALRTMAGAARWATPGLTPLAGSVPSWLRLVRMASLPLYDFDGLRRFRARLLPARWRPVWLVWDHGPLLFVLADVLRAFAGGRLGSFAARSLTRHPNGPPWLVAVPLVPWTAGLTILLAAGRADLLAFSPAALAAWIAFDIAIAALLLRAAHRPRRRGLLALAAAAFVDAVLSVRHLAAAGLGEGVVAPILRVAATAGPVLGTVALLWAGYRARTLVKRS